VPDFHELPLASVLDALHNIESAPNRLSRSSTVTAARRKNELAGDRHSIDSTIFALSQQSAPLVMPERSRPATLP
jgi:hypothetical protein